MLKYFVLVTCVSGYFELGFPTTFFLLLTTLLASRLFYLFYQKLNYQINTRSLRIEVLKVDFPVFVLVTSLLGYFELGFQTFILLVTIILISRWLYQKLKHRINARYQLDEKKKEDGGTIGSTPLLSKIIGEVWEEAVAYTKEQARQFVIAAHDKKTKKKLKLSVIDEANLGIQPLSVTLLSDIENSQDPKSKVEKVKMDVEMRYLSDDSSTDIKFSFDHIADRPITEKIAVQVEKIKMAVVCCVTILLHHDDKDEPAPKARVHLSCLKTPEIKLNLLNKLDNGDGGVRSCGINVHRIEEMMAESIKSKLSASHIAFELDATIIEDKSLAVKRSSVNSIESKPSSSPALSDATTEEKLAFKNAVTAIDDDHFRVMQRLLGQRWEAILSRFVDKTCSAKNISAVAHGMITELAKFVESELQLQAPTAFTSNEIEASTSPPINTDDAQLVQEPACNVISSEDLGMIPSCTTASSDEGYSSDENENWIRPMKFEKDESFSSIKPTFIESYSPDEHSKQLQEDTRPLSAPSSDDDSRESSPELNNFNNLTTFNNFNIKVDEQNNSPFNEDHDDSAIDQEKFKADAINFTPEFVSLHYTRYEIVFKSKILANLISL